MKKEERVLEFIGNLGEEFEEIKKLADKNDGVPYGTWTRVCSTFLTIICC